MIFTKIWKKYRGNCFLVAHLREIEVLKLFTELDRNIAIPRYYGSREFRPQQIGHGCILMEDMQNSSPPPMSEGCQKVFFVSFEKTGIF